MKVSRQIWVDDKVKWNPLVKIKLCQKNQYSGQAYMVCTSPNPHLLFEIFEAGNLNNSYQTATLLAVCKSKKKAIELVAEFIDSIYNKQVKKYEDFLE